MIGGAALADEDVAGEHDLVAVPLHAETAARTVAPVARGATCFFMRHGRLLLFRRGLFRRLLLRLGSGGPLRGGLKIGFLAIGVDAGDAEHPAQLARAVLPPPLMPPPPLSTHSPSSPSLLPLPSCVPLPCPP